MERMNCRFAPFNGAYGGHKQAMEAASLNPERNLWFAVYDFNHDNITGRNWRYLNTTEENPLWTPLSDEAKNCCPRVEPGAVSALPKKGNRDAENSLSENPISKRSQNNKPSEIGWNNSKPINYTSLSDVMNDNLNPNNDIVTPITKQSSTIASFGSFSAGCSNLGDLFSPIYENLNQTARMIASSVAHTVEQCRQLLCQLFD